MVMLNMYDKEKKVTIYATTEKLSYNPKSLSCQDKVIDESDDENETDSVYPSQESYHSLRSFDNEYELLSYGETYAYSKMNPFMKVNSKFPSVIAFMEIKSASGEFMLFLHKMGLLLNKLQRCSQTVVGPPLHNSWIEIDKTLIAGIRPVVFSSTHCIVGDAIIFYNRQKKAFIIHGVRVDEYQSAKGAPTDPSIRNLDALDLATVVENHDISKRHHQGDVEQYVWNSQAGGSFTSTHGIDETRGRNTKITPFLKGYQLEYLEEHSFEELSKKRSDFMSYTISIWIEKMIKEEISNREDRMAHYFLHVVSLLFSSLELHTKSATDIRIGVLEEKTVAMQACGLFVLNTKSVYVPHLEASCGYLIWSTGYFHEDTLRVVDTAYKMSVWAAKQRDVWVNEHSDTKNTIKRIKDGLKVKETDDGQQQQEKFEGFVVSFLEPLILYLHSCLHYNLTTKNNFKIKTKTDNWKIPKTLVSVTKPNLNDKHK
ncbi:unnamed protein product [Lactuca saligna]|uniref:Uncharacterized protein n=1 Tax=Lactuca saligna TaxID=75948 RepID=A0AA35V3T5_LACSI|nr:unnamed protein product [Lactuca saligna]